MKHGGRIGLRVLTGALLSASAIVLTSLGAAENPYSSIVERNVFNLHPPPPPINPADLIKKTPPPKITFTGITTILGKKLALLTYAAAKPNTPPISVMLAEGQAQDEVEVKSIDERAGVVQIVNHGEEETLDFEHDAPKGSGPMPGVAPGATTMPAPTAAPPQNGVQPSQNPGNVIRPLRAMQSRNLDGNNGGQGGQGFGGTMNGGQMNQNQNLSPEEQVALIELQRVEAIKNNDPVKDILPPTELTPEVTGQQAPTPGF